MENRKILPGITTTARSNWRDKMKEIDDFGISEVALFPTCLEHHERQELYKMLEEKKDLSIPFVHLRHDMMDGEIDYLSERFGARCFNIHPFMDIYENMSKSRFREKIFIENLYDDDKIVFDLELIRKYGFAGACVDFSHLAAEEKTNVDSYKKKLEIIQSLNVGCNHVSVCYDEKKYEPTIDKYVFDSHMMEKSVDFNYLKKFPISFFSNYLALELENSLREQLDAGKYLQEIIKEKENE